MLVWVVMVLAVVVDKEAWEILLAGVQNLSPCNHEEEDTCITYHHTLEDKPTVVTALDTDILIPTVHVFVSVFPIMTGFYNQEKTVCECF